MTWLLRLPILHIGPVTCQIKIETPCNVRLFWYSHPHAFWPWDTRLTVFRHYSFLYTTFQILTLACTHTHTLISTLAHTLTHTHVHIHTNISYRPMSVCITGSEVHLFSLFVLYVLIWRRITDFHIIIYFGCVSILSSLFLGLLFLALY